MAALLIRKQTPPRYTCCGRITNVKPGVYLRSWPASVLIPPRGIFTDKLIRNSDIRRPCSPREPGKHRAVIRHLRGPLARSIWSAARTGFLDAHDRVGGDHPRCCGRRCGRPLHVSAPSSRRSGMGRYSAEVVYARRHMSRTGVGRMTLEQRGRRARLDGGQRPGTGSVLRNVTQPPGQRLLCLRH